MGSASGYEVITSPFTMVSTVEAIISAGCKPVFADINPKTLTIDPQDVARKITKKTFAVMPVDIAGYPSDYDSLRKICKEKALPLISDSAHSVGTLFKNKPVCNYADASIISFHATKNLVCGEGGIVLSKHKKLIETIRQLSKHGMSSSAHERKDKKNRWFYDVTSFGFKANMSELHAAVGLGQLGGFKSEQKKREKLALRYLENLKGLSEYMELSHINKKVTHGWHLFIIRLNLSNIKLSRDEFIRKMGQSKIECGVHYRPVFELSYYKDALKLSKKKFPNASYAGERVVTLPLYPGLKFSDIDYICDNIVKILN
jgi:dTDP-4-amino-4,6-dideoxygalactose transaminase